MRNRATNAELEKLKADLVPELPTITKNTVWKNDRNARTDYVVVTDVKTNHVVCKRHTEAADSSTFTHREFVKKYKPAVGNEGREEVRLK